MPVLNDLPVPMIARRIEVLGRRVRLAFDPLPGRSRRRVAISCSPVRLEEVADLRTSHSHRTTRQLCSIALPG